MTITRNELNDYDTMRGMILQDVRKVENIELIQECEGVYLFRIGLDKFINIVL